MAVSSSPNLTPEEFDALLALLHPDREKAGEIYEDIRRRLIRIFEWRGCARSSELADEVYNRVARKVVGGLTFQRSDPFPYFSAVAHHVFQEAVRREAREHQALDNEGWSFAASLEQETDRRLDHLRDCLQILGSAQRRLLLRYHEADQRIRARKDLCHELGIPMNALRIRVHRLRKKVESCVQDKLRS